jgi:hypothetical protein
MNEEVLFELYSKIDLVVFPDREWYDSLYHQASCGKCHDVFNHLRYNPLAVRIASGKNLTGPLAGIWRVNAALVREELAADLDLESRGAVLGPVMQSASLLEGWASMLVPDENRVRMRSDPAYEINPCPTCGRLCYKGGNWNRRWILSEDLAGKDLVFSETGSAILVSTRMRQELRPTLSKQLRFEPIQIRKTAQ